MTRCWRPRPRPKLKTHLRRFPGWSFHHDGRELSTRCGIYSARFVRRNPTCLRCKRLMR